MLDCWARDAEVTEGAGSESALHSEVKSETAADCGLWIPFRFVGVALKVSAQLRIEDFAETRAAHVRSLPDFHEPSMQIVGIEEWAVHEY